MKAHLTKVSLALLSTVFLLGCQDLGSEPVGPDGPQFNKPTGGKHNHGGDVEDGGGCGNNCVFVDVALDGWMITSENQTDQMELVRKGDIIKLRANGGKAETPFLKFAIDMSKTLTKLTSGTKLEEKRASLNANCVWSGRVEQTERNTDHVITELKSILTDARVIERSVLVGIDQSVFEKQTDGSFVSVSENNAMAIQSTPTVGSQDIRVKGGAPTVTVVGDDPRTGDNFTATFVGGEFVGGEFVGGKVDLTVGDVPDDRNVVHLSCNLFDDISFEVVEKG